MQERTLPKERKKERWTRGMGSEEVKEAKEEAKAKPAVASSGDLSFDLKLCWPSTGPSSLRLRR